jgi:hypothetical protein
MLCTGIAAGLSTRCWLSPVARSDRRLPGRGAWRALHSGSGDQRGGYPGRVVVDHQSVARCQRRRVDGRPPLLADLFGHV